MCSSDLAHTHTPHTTTDITTPHTGEAHGLGLMSLPSFPLCGCKVGSLSLQCSCLWVAEEEGGTGLSSSSAPWTASRGNYVPAAYLPRGSHFQYLITMCGAGSVCARVCLHACRCFNPTSTPPPPHLPEFFPSPSRNLSGLTQSLG